jgi:hypothetical protein
MFFLIELLKVWLNFYATSDIFLCFMCLLQFFKVDNQKCLRFFKWQLPFLILDINVKFYFRVTFINIVCAYFQAFWRNFYFMNKIFFFLSSNCFICLFFSKIALQ